MTSGFSRYIFGEKYILNSDSFKDAIGKVKKDLQKYGEGNVYYKEESLWYEYQFLFMIQYIEHNIAEFIFKLALDGKINEDCLQSMKNYKKLDEKRKGTKRAFSPYALSVCMGYNLGDLIKLIRERIIDFDNKESLLSYLEEFNALRIDFIHKSFSSSKDMTKTIQRGIKSSKEILKLI